MTAPQQLYDRDFFEWTQCTAALLRAGRFDQADIEHVAEEIEDMGKRERRELVHRIAILMAHLLKWQVQPERRSRSWELTIRVQRKGIAKLLKGMPSLRPFLEENLEDAYEEALAQALNETGQVESVFPPTCPYTIDVILDPEFLP